LAPGLADFSSDKKAFLLLDCVIKKLTGACLANQNCLNDETCHNRLWGGMRALDRTHRWNWLPLKLNLEFY